MESDRFDAFARILSVARTRRDVAALLATGPLARLRGVETAAAKRKKRKRKKKKKKKSNRCVTFGNRVINCAPGLLCCDPNASTVAACREPGFPVCCVSSGFSHPPGSRCCSSFFDGLDGSCPPEAPVCCSAIVNAGCCPAAFPVCCPFDCCAPDDFCHEDGFCFFDPGFLAREVGAEGGGRKRTHNRDSGPRGRFTEPPQDPS